MSLGQGRFLEARLKRKLLQEKANLRPKKTIEQQLRELEDPPEKENMNMAERLQNSLRSNPSKTVSNQKSIMGNSGFGMAHTGKQLNTVGMNETLKQMVVEHCEGDMVKPEFTTGLLEVRGIHRRTNPSEIGHRFKTVKEFYKTKPLNVEHTNGLAKLNQTLKECNSKDHLAMRKRLNVGEANDFTSEYKEKYMDDEKIRNELRRGGVNFNKVRNELTEVNSAYFRYKKILSKIPNYKKNSKKDD